MIKKIRLCLLISIISFYSSLPSLAMDQDQEIRNRITRKIAKYEIKINDLRRLLENFQINPSPPTAPLPVPQKNIPNQIANQQEPITPPNTHQQIPRQINSQEITDDQIRLYIRGMHNNGNGRTLADIGELLGYSPDISQSTPQGKSTGKSAVSKFLSGQNSPTVCKKFRKRVREGVIHFPPLQPENNNEVLGSGNTIPLNPPQLALSNELPQNHPPVTAVPRTNIIASGEGAVATITTATTSVSIGTTTTTNNN